MTAAAPALLRTDGLLGLALAAWAQIAPDVADELLGTGDDADRATAGPSTGD